MTAWAVRVQPWRTRLTAPLDHGLIIQCQVALRVSFARSIPTPQVASCWSDNSATDVVNYHQYSTDFPSWNTSIHAAPAKGALVTEAGSRWYQGQKDYGSVITVMHFMFGQAAQAKAKPELQVPGVMLNWEVMVGNSNTRWQWRAHPGDPEPAIPWDGTIWPNGEPVSYTEACAIRAWVRNNVGEGSPGFVDDKPGASPIFVDAFLPEPTGDSWLTDDVWLYLPEGVAWVALPDLAPEPGCSALRRWNPVEEGPGAPIFENDKVAKDGKVAKDDASPIEVGDGVVEASLWVNGSTTAELWVRATTSSSDVARFTACSSSEDRAHADAAGTPLHLPVVADRTADNQGIAVGSGVRQGAKFDSGLVVTLNSATQVVTL